MFDMAGEESVVERGNPNPREEEDSNDDMEGMKTHKRVECRAEDIRADGEVFFHDEVAPLPTRAIKEVEAQGDGKAPPKEKSHTLSDAKEFLRDENRRTAAEEGEAAQKRKFEDILWQWPGEAFVNVEEVGNDKNREQGGLRHDEADDPQFSWRRQFPVCR